MISICQIPTRRFKNTSKDEQAEIAKAAAKIANASIMSGIRRDNIDYLCEALRCGIYYDLEYDSKNKFKKILNLTEDEFISLEKIFGNLDPGDWNSYDLKLDDFIKKNKLIFQNNSI